MNSIDDVVVSKIITPEDIVGVMRQAWKIIEQGRDAMITFLHGRYKVQLVDTLDDELYDLVVKTLHAEMICAKEDAAKEE